MRRFVKTFYVKRLAQVTVVRDSELKMFEVYRWRVESPTCERLVGMAYEPGRMDDVQPQAVAFALRVADAERALDVSPIVAARDRSARVQ